MKLKWVESSWDIPWSVASNPYQLHRAIWHGFPGMTVRPFLFRIDDYQRRDKIRVSVRSTVVPVDDPFLLSVENREDVIRSGDEFDFRTCVNPVVRRDGKKFGLAGNGSRLEWFRRQLWNAAKILQAAVVLDAGVAFEKNGHSGFCRHVWIEGRLRVISPEALSMLVENGVGPAKAFGCGMIELSASSLS